MDPEVMISWEEEVHTLVSAGKVRKGHRARRTVLGDVGRP